MLDSIQIGMVRLKDKDEAVGYMRRTKKNDPHGQVWGYFRIPLYVVFDQEGYNSYKEYVKKENPEFKTWISDVVLKIPPSEENGKLCVSCGNEMFLGMIRTLSQKSPRFPEKLKRDIDQCIQKYWHIKRNAPPPPEEENDYQEYVSPEIKFAVENAMRIFGILQRSRFDAGRPNRKGEFRIPPFVRGKEDKTAKEVIKESTNLVFNYLLENPKLSKFSEADGRGLKIKLTSVFMECFYKEQIRFMAKKLQVPSPFKKQ